MGRPVKQGVEFFPFDIGFFQDIKVRKLIRYQGGKAITVYIILLCIIYRDGYYVRWDEELPFIISELSGYEEMYVREVIKCCRTVGLLNKRLFDEEHVLTSKGIQQRYINMRRACRRNANINEFRCLSDGVEKTYQIDSFDLVENNSATLKGTATSSQSLLDREIEQLKKDVCWLDPLQLVHHMPIDKLRQRLDEFRLQCIADGRMGHNDIPDAKRHFNNWLRVVNKNDKDRIDTRAGRRGNLLKADTKKEYSDTF
jgi:dnaD domain protein